MRKINEPTPNREATSSLDCPRCEGGTRRIREIIIHCSATPEGKDFTVEDIDNWHKARGFKCIGYHYIVYRDGTIHKGRDDNTIGAHCKGHNAHSIGICYIGGCRASPRGGLVGVDTRTPEQKASLLKLLKDLKQRFPGATIHGHNEFAPKACPCFDVKTEYKQLTNNN